MSQPPRGLGRGLSAILGDISGADDLRKPVTYQDKNKVGSPASPRTTADVFRVPTGQISPNPYQPRLSFDSEELEGLAASIRTIKEIFPGRNVCAVFQPHLFTRTRDFAKEFAEALSLADEAVLLDIYPARELPIEGITSEIIYKDVTCSEKWLLHYEDLLDWVKTHETDVLVTFGAGNIDRLVKPIKEILERK